MTWIRRLAQDRPFVFVIGLFVADNLVAVPFVVAFRALGLEQEGLRLVIPTAQSIFILWLIWALGWVTRSGLTTTVRDIHVYWYPVVLAFVPVLAYGTVDVASGPLAFYAGAVLVTGISEEGLARGVILPALLPRGKWLALLLAATLFSVGHLTNLAFEDFGALQMANVLTSTFGFAVLYGAVFIRTRNLWPLMVLHAIHDYAFVTSGTAGPFTIEPLSIPLGMGLSVLSILYGAFIVRNASWDDPGVDARVT